MATTKPVPSMTGEPETTDRIEKRFEVAAERPRVWRAVADAAEFGAWFGMALDGPFVPGATVFGRLTIPGYDHLTVAIHVDTVVPERYFSYRWHPYAVDPTIDYGAEPTTLVEFRLEASEGGTTVTITESGFDRLPPSRRAEAFRKNEEGWTGQSRKLAAFVG